MSILVHFTNPLKIVVYIPPKMCYTISTVRRVGRPGQIEKNNITAGEFGFRKAIQGRF
jgi:hypothetical protein